MKLKNALGLVVALTACGGSRTEPAAATAPADSAAADSPIVRPPADPAPDPQATPPAPVGPETAAPAGSEPAAPGARLAFTPCEATRPQICTKEYRPVCGEVDTGIRCIKAPCPSASKRTFGNACSACSDEKTAGYWPMACEKLPLDSAP